MSNANEIVGPSCPEFPVERYASELLFNIESPVLSSRLVIISENLDRVREHYERSLFRDEKLDFILDTLSSVLVLTVAVLRYKATDRTRVVTNVIAMLKYIARHYPKDEFPEFCSSVPRPNLEPSEVIPDVDVQEVKAPPRSKKGGVSK